MRVLPSPGLVFVATLFKSCKVVEMKITESLANDAFKMMHEMYSKKENKTKVDHITRSIMDTLIDKLKPYFFLITGLLVIMILMNCIQFYYYIKVYLKQFDTSSRLAAVNEIL